MTSVVFVDLSTGELQAGDSSLLSDYAGAMSNKEAGVEASQTMQLFLINW